MDNELFETIRSEASQYGQAIGKVGRLHFVGIISRVLGLFLLLLTVVLCVLALFTFGAVALIDILGNHMPIWGASLIVGSLYIIIIVVAIVCRRPLFVHPFIALLTKHVIRTQRELDLETLKATQEVELQNVRLETKVDNATREISFYVTIIRRVWKWLSGRIRKNAA